ncbi:MAG TPA: PEPxxWA-CTERM sorting domain-containing protein [Sphingomicrobium sp.]
MLAPSVPEPASWTMMLVGFAGIGLAMRRRRRTRRRRFQLS